MSKATLATFGVYYGNTPIEALDAFAQEKSCDTFEELRGKIGLPFEYEVREGFRVMI